MTLLLDTQALVWWRQASRRLGPKARRAIEVHATTIYVSAASAWELAIKSRLEKFRLRERIQDWIPHAIDEGGFLVLDVSLDHAIGVADLPFHHADPFDRLLIAQARHEELTIVTSDTAFDAYDVETLDARR